MEKWFANPAPFEAFGATHKLVLLFTLASVVGMCLVARGRQPRLGIGSRPERTLALALAAVLFLSWPIKVWVYRIMGADYVLPMHLCDWAAIAGGVALVLQRPLAAEMVYFWGMAGTLNGLLTPDLGQGFPHPRFFVFFALHAGVVITALYVVIGLRLYPRPNAIWRMFAWTQVYVLVAFGVNLWMENSELVESNYGFLMEKPLDADNPVLNALGPWPWYIFGLQAVCLVAFCILNTPFWILRRRATRREEV